MKIKKKFIKIAIDSPAAAGAGTLAKNLAKHYNLLYVDTGKAYRILAKHKINNPKKFNIIFAKKKIRNLKIKDLNKKNLLSNKIGIEASILAKQKSIRNLVYKFQTKLAYSPPKKYSGSCLDGRDITYNIVPDADFKFFITASIKTRAMRRYRELNQLNMKLSYKEVLKSIKLRDKRDYSRKIAPLKKTKDSILINTTNLSKRACFLKIKKIIDRKLIVNGNI
tara:strand:+ start:3593 stop:4261 length:669 start_codon:yes stop_codon:yes gene_type:complete